MTYQTNLYGEELKIKCPVCGSSQIRNEWRIPMTDISPALSYKGSYYNQLPLLKSPFTVFCFDFCKECESIFLNPDVPRDRLISIYKKSTSYINKMQEPEAWHGYTERYSMMKAYLPTPCTFLIDAASGLGQIATLARADETLNLKRVMALELSSHYVEHMQSIGIDAHEFDIDFDDISNLSLSNSADFVVFFEAFEHVASPTKALEKLLATLRVGGRIFFSAQRYGDDVDLPIRPGEPIYIGEQYLSTIELCLPCKLIDVVKSGSRYFVVLEKEDRSIRDTMAIPPLERIKGHFEHAGGFCWVVPIASHADREGVPPQNMADDDHNPTRSRLRVFEKAGSQVQELTPPHSPHSDIREIGRGQFSHWKTNLYFSTSDNSDPNKNGRSYFFSTSPI